MGLVRTVENTTIVWTIDKPEARNALDLATIQELTHALREPTEARAAIIMGGGETFVSGGDLNELRGKDTRADAERLSDAGFALMSAIAEAPFPVIAAINGHAIGGGAELAVACDLRIASERARISFKHVRMGVTTSWGTMSRLRELVGHGSATYLLLTAGDVSAKKAKKMGLVDDTAEDPRVGALEVAAEIAKAPVGAVTAMKKLLRARGTNEELRKLERELFVDAWAGDEHKTAVNAWFARKTS